MGDTPPHVWVYMVQTERAGIYIGFTRNIFQRIRQHESGKGGARYIKAYGYKDYVAWRCPTVRLAIQMERRLKQMPAKKKRALFAEPHCGLFEKMLQRLHH